MNCKKAEESMQRAIDRDLSSTQRTELDRHIADCPNCAATFDDYLHVRRSATEWAVSLASSHGQNNKAAENIASFICKRTPGEVGQKRRRNIVVLATVSVLILATALAGQFVTIPAVPIHFSLQWDFSFASITSEIADDCRSSWQTLNEGTSVLGNSQLNSDAIGFLAAGLLLANIFLYRNSGWRRNNTS